MNYSGKRLLILGGAPQLLRVVETAKEMGVYTIVSDMENDTVTKSVADESLPFSVMDSCALINWCKENPIDGCLNFNVDFSQRSHYKICSEFGLPCYGTWEQYSALTDKALFKKCCIENDVSVVRKYDYEDKEEIEYPVFVKPAESSGSRGSSVCRDEAELTASIERAKSFSRNGQALIEQYMDRKHEFEILYLVRDGNPHLIYIADRYLGRKEDGLEKVGSCFSTPSRYLEQYLNSAHHKVVMMLEKMGIINAPVFLQCFYDPSIRFPGDTLYTIVKNTTGLDLPKIMIEYALSGRIAGNVSFDSIFRFNGYECALILFYAKEGLITRFDGVEQIMKCPSVVNVCQKRRVGERIKGTMDVTQRILEIAIVCDNKNMLVEEIQKTEQMLTVLNDKGEDMIVSSFDPNVLL